MSNKFKLKPLAAAMMPLLLTGNSALVFAQDNVNQKATPDSTETEIIEVKGFKGSLLRSLNNKRLNDTISDSIFSEDIGKSADQDIGEALQRITGVSIQRGGGATDGGDSTTISVRGASPDLNVISLNGVTLTSSTENQTVDLSAYSSDILNSIEVIKTASADQDEGSLGASVILKTFRPLDAKENKRVLEIQGRYGDFVEETDYKVSGSFSEKFLDDTLGFYITAFKEQQAYRKDSFFTNNFEIETYPYAVDSKTGEVIDGGFDPLTGERRPLTGYQNGQNGYSLFVNSLEREGFTSAIQWRPTDETEVTLDVTMSDQFLVTDQNSFTVLGASSEYKDDDPIATGQDPWLVYNTENEMFVKVLARSARGRIQQIESGVETTNRIFSLDVNHYFTDSFSMNFRAGYSKTVADDDYYTFINTNNFVHVTDELLDSIPLDSVEPVGYDCTSGRCLARFGSGLVNFGPGQTGAQSEDNSDNTTTTGFNPDDLASTHLQQVNTRDRDMSDEQKQVFLDFDYDANWGPITTVEFGLKYQKRNKDVFNQNNFFEGVPQPFGQEELGIGIASIQLSQVTKGQTPFGDNFLEGLGYGRDNATDGWLTIDGAKVLDALFVNRDVRTKPDLSNDRQVQLENTAIYLKTSFSFLDDDLTGNIGFRYVESQVDSLGYSGVKYNLGIFASSWELLQIAADSSLAPCTDAQLYNNGVDYADGANLAGEFDANGNFGPAAGQSCFDADYNQSAQTRSRYWDASLQRDDPDQFQATGSNKSNNFLPSLSLNYQLNDETVLRFAASKTMARPKIDSLKPSYKLSYDLWSGGDSGGTISNPGLVALESNNLDLSYEWYFADGGAFSAALFYKDMSNFEEVAIVSSHWQNIANLSQSELEALNPLDALREKNSDGTPKTIFEVQDCMPNYRHRWQSNAVEIATLCDTINLNLIRNGKGATNQGLELGYTQNYDFLPGILGGLGMSANYTYSDSKTEAEVIGFDTQLSSLPLANVSKHQYNISTYWEQDGNLIRIAYNHRTDSLATRSFRSGALWNEGGGSLDISATYTLNDTFTFTFNAVNLNERVFRQYYTNLSDTSVQLEGNALEGEANKSRTIREWATGATYRIGVRATF